MESFWDDYRHLLTSWGHFDPFVKGLIYGCGSTAGSAVLGYCGRKLPGKTLRALSWSLKAPFKVFPWAFGRDRGLGDLALFVLDDIRHRRYVLPPGGRLVQAASGRWATETSPNIAGHFDLYVFDPSAGEKLWATDSLTPRERKRLRRAVRKILYTQGREDDARRRDSLAALLSAPAVESYKAVEPPRAYGVPTPERVPQGEVPENYGGSLSAGPPARVEAISHSCRPGCVVCGALKQDVAL